VACGSCGRRRPFAGVQGLCGRAAVGASTGPADSTGLSCGAGQGWLEPAPVGLAFDDEVEGVVHEANDGALSADGVGEGGKPVVGAAV
jgi:hypothetical protein